jgi:hypothetical protein
MVDPTNLMVDRSGNLRMINLRLDLDLGVGRSGSFLTASDRLHSTDFRSMWAAAEPTRFAVRLSTWPPKRSQAKVSRTLCFPGVEQCSDC